MINLITRRSFIKTTGVIGVNAIFGSQMLRDFSFGNDMIDLAVVKGDDREHITRKAVDLLGGMTRFVPKNAKVAILPNPGSSNPGTYTKPEIMQATIRMCRQAGASEIACITWLTMRDWINCGLKKVIDQEGIDLIITDLRDESEFKPVSVPNGIGLKEVRIMKTCFDYDILIDLPITKEHSGNKYSGALKNLMGLNSPKSCRTFHRRDWMLDSDSIEHLEQCIADLNTVIYPDLCIVDATEFVITNGPYGPGEAQQTPKGNRRC